MTALIVSLNAVAPLLFEMLLGYYGKQKQFFSEESVHSMNRFSYQFLFPTLVFYNIYKADINGNIPWGLLAFSILAMVLSMIIAMVLAGKIEGNLHKRSVLAHGAFRPNFVLFAIPIASAIYDENGLGFLPVLIAVLVPILNIMSVICFESMRGKKPDLKVIVQGVLRNPLIKASLLAISFQILGIRFPSYIEKAVTDIAKMTSPLALIMLGATFRFSSLEGDKKDIIFGAVFKLVVLPLAFVPVAFLLGYRNIDLLSLLILLGAPDAISCYQLAVEYDGDEELAASLVVITSVLSIFSMFVWIFILKTLMLL